MVQQEFKFVCCNCKAMVETTIDDGVLNEAVCKFCGSHYNGNIDMVIKTFNNGKIAGETPASIDEVMELVDDKLRDLEFEISCMRDDIRNELLSRS